MPERLRPERARSANLSLSHQEGEHVAELLVFVCNEELYAVELGSVHEIVIPPPVTLVPRCPPAIVGVCSVRGELATIVDLRTVLSMPPHSGTDKGRYLLARVGDSELVGLWVDEVRQVVRLRDSQLEYSSQNLGADLSETVIGIGRPSDSEVIVILDLAAVLEKGCS